MLDKKLEAAFNDQINKELYSEYLYLGMKSIFADMNLPGFVNWFDVQVQEERAHAMGMFDYVHERNAQVTLAAIDKPEIKGSTPLEIFEQVLEHEEFVTSRINALYDVAEETKDRAAMQFLDWFVKEQGEEETNANDLITKMELFGSDPKSLYMLNQELAARVYSAPSLVL